MPDPGDPYGGDIAVQVMRSPPVTGSIEPTPAKPWHGPYVSVPAFINSCPVVAALQLMSSPGEPAEQRFAVVYPDNGRQGGDEGTLVVAVVSFTNSYRVRQKWVGWNTYAGAVSKMQTVARRANLGEALDDDVSAPAPQAR